MRRAIEHVRVIGCDVEVSWPVEYAADSNLGGRAYEPWKLNLAAAAGGRLFVALRDVLLVRPLDMFMYHCASNVQLCDDTIVLGAQRGSEDHVVNALRPGTLFGADVVVASCQGGHVFVIPARDPFDRQKWRCFCVSAPAWSVALAPHGPGRAVLAVGANNHAVTLFTILEDGSVCSTTQLPVHRHNVPFVDLMDGLGASASIDCSCAIWPIDSTLSPDFNDPETVAAGSGPLGFNQWDIQPLSESLSFADDNFGRPESRNTASLPSAFPIGDEQESSINMPAYLRVNLDRAWGWTAILIRAGDIARTMRSGDLGQRHQDHTRIFRPQDGGEVDTALHPELSRRLTLGETSISAILAAEDAMFEIDQLDLGSDEEEDGSTSVISHDDYPDFSHGIVRTGGAVRSVRAQTNSFGALATHTDISSAHMSDMPSSLSSDIEARIGYVDSWDLGDVHQSPTDHLASFSQCNVNTTGSTDESSDLPREMPRGLLRTWTPEAHPDFSRLHSRCATPHSAPTDILVAVTTERRLFIVHAATGAVLRTVDYIEQMYWDVHGPPLDPVLLGMSRLSMAHWLPSLSVLVLGCQMGYVAVVHVCMPPAGLVLSTPGMAGNVPLSVSSARHAWSGTVGEDVVVVALPWAYRSEDEWSANGSVRPASWLHGLAVIEIETEQSATVLAVDGMGRVSTIYIVRKRPPCVIT